MAKAAAEDVAATDAQDRVLTIPNAISLARLAGVPVFLWLVLGLRTQTGDWWAFGLLIASGLSDWLDGKIARALNQQSRLGQLLDPTADRAYIVATVIALAVRAIIPWWLVILLAVRELMLGIVLLVLRRHGYGPLQVSFAGKAATLTLLYAFPLLFLGAHTAVYSEVAENRRLGVCHLGKCTVLVRRRVVRGAGATHTSGGIGGAFPYDNAAGGSTDSSPRVTPGGTGRLGRGEGCRDGGRRGHSAAPDDR